MAGDNQTAVLGGLISTQDTVDTKQVPFLGSIPLLGNLFKNKVKSKQKTELILFITPYVILSSQDMNKVKEGIINKAPSLTPSQINEITNDGLHQSITNRGSTNEVH